MRSVTVTSARAIGRTDRGELAIGQRADLVFAQGSSTNVRATGVVCNGQRIR